jgi:hypothetical protein
MIGAATAGMKNFLVVLCGHWAWAVATAHQTASAVMSGFMIDCPVVMEVISAAR